MITLYMLCWDTMHEGVFKALESANVIIDLKNIAELQTVKVNDIW